MIRLRADSVRLRRSLRQREVQAVFGHVPDDYFDEALELGAGDGAQSRLLARCARRVVCTDLNADRLIGDTHPRITYEVCDAEELPYDANRFDLIYSSNLLEHLPSPEKALSEMHRVLKTDGVMVHVVPNRFWKLLHLALFYPSQMLSAAELLLSAERAKPPSNGRTAGNNLKGRQPSFIMRKLVPTVHGEYPNHLVELSRMGSSHWKRVFSEAGFHLVGLVGKLPAHSPYRFGMEMPRRVFESVGFSSCNGYILAKDGQSSEGADAVSSGK
jgi:SAM-dependent methyltransferase